MCILIPLNPPTLRVTIKYQGDKFMKIKHLGTIAGTQDGAIFNNYLFRFTAKGVCHVFDLRKGFPNPSDTYNATAQFTLDKAESIMPHSNAVTFGNEYFDEADEFPLLYSNIYNNYASAENKKKGVTCVYRIKKNDTGFSSELVQLIEIAFTEDELWCSKNTKDVRPFGNLIIDREASLCYEFTMRDEEQTTRYFSFRLPKVNEGKFDEEFKVNRVSLRMEDILSMFDCEYHRYLQGACCHNGLIYSLEGFTNNPKNPPAIRVIDPKGKKQLDMYAFSDYGLTIEPEMIDFSDDVCYYSDHSGNLYILEF